MPTNDCKQSFSDRELAELFLREKTPQQAIPEVFRYFSMNCFDFCKLNPAELDALIERFEAASGDKTEQLIKIIALIRSVTPAAQPEKPRLAEEIVSYIDEHFCDNIGIEQIARQLGISFHYMCHLFKAHTGVTVSSYRNKKRIMKAQRLLVGTGERVSDIAGACGYGSISYFTETFTAAVGLSPSEFRAAQKDTVYLPFYNDDDMLLANRIPSRRLMGDIEDIPRTAAETYTVHHPDAEYSFLHEAAIIAYHGVLYASWYNCPSVELHGRTPIRGRRSYDGGRTWSDIEVIADDPTGKILYCPPVYGICDDRLYMLLNQMVAPDHIHALDCYLLDPDTDRFIRLWSKPIPFKLNTNAVRLANGKLMLPGRVGQMDGFPNTPAVLISDSGRIDAEWRLVQIAENGELPDGEHLVFPELTVVQTDGRRLYMFSRNDRRRVPLVYTSEDEGETWSGPQACDIPFISSKIYAGTLSDGRNYVIGNILKGDRSRLALYLSHPGTMQLCKRLILRDGPEPGYEKASGWHYPAAYECSGKLYIIYTANLDGNQYRGAVLSVVDLSKI